MEMSALLNKMLVFLVLMVIGYVPARRGSLSRDAIKAIPEETYYPMYSLGAKFRQILVEVIFPASLPKFITAVRVAMATAISVLFFTETFGTRYGMGYYIMDAWLRVNYLDMYAGIVVLSLIGLCLFGIIDMVEARACRWQK